MTFRRARPIIIALTASNIGVYLGGFFGWQAWRLWCVALQDDEVSANPNLDAMGLLIVLGGCLGFAIFAILGLMLIHRFDPVPPRLPR